MTDEITPQTHPPMKKDEKKPSVSANTRGPKRQPQNLRGGTPTARSLSKGSNKKPPNPSSASAVESGSDTASRKGSENGKKQEPRARQQPTGGRAPVHRKAQLSVSQGARNTKDQGSKQSSSPAPPQNNESDALSSLQRVIEDLKSTSPVQHSIGSNNPPPPMTAAQSNLTSHAPPFQPGAAGYPTLSTDQKHRKAFSLGTSTLPSSNFNSFSPHLGAMIEDVEDSGAFEEGEIQERYYPQPGHQPRSQSQSFMAPRFAALAAQQEQDSVGPTGRPQLAPGFMFGARSKRIGVMGPPIDEEDINFQFPQQNQQQSLAPEISQQGQTHKKSESGEITGIMAEQVNFNLVDYSSSFKKYIRSLFRIR